MKNFQLCIKHNRVLNYNCSINKFRKKAKALNLTFKKLKLISTISIKCLRSKLNKKLYL